jgi:hypothetical protein
MGSKRSLAFGLGLAAIMLGGAIPASAAGQKDPGTIRKTVVLLQDATLNGSSVARGEYEAEVSGADDATLVLRHDRKEVARASVRRVALAAPAKYDRVDVRATAAGKEVAVLYFKGDPRAFEVLASDGVAAAPKP